MAKHIGYFNDPEDIKELFDETDEEVIKYYLEDFGAFHESDEPMSTKGLKPVSVKGNKWYVKRDINPDDIDSEDNFIDLFKVA